MPEVRANNVTLFYEEQGSGLPLILLHGWTANRGSWKVQMPVLSRYYRVIALDQRGQGDSEPAPDDDYSLAAFAEDVRALLDVLGIGKGVVLGHSMGGMIAQEFALRYPGRLKALILFGTRSTLGPSVEGTGGPYGEEAARAVKTMGMYEVARMMAPHLFTPGVPQEMIDLLIQESSRVPIEMAAGFWTCNEGWDVRHRLHEIKVPTLVIVGSLDQRTPVGEGEKLNRAVPNAWLKVIKGTGHMANWEKPAEFTQAILDFLTMIE